MIYTNIISRSMSKKPMYITVENVKGFETSKTHESLIKMLENCDYNYKVSWHRNEYLAGLDSENNSLCN